MEALHPSPDIHRENVCFKQKNLALKSQIVVVTHALRLITALKEQEGCHSITLEKTFGETTIVGTKQMDLPAWNWPAR